METPSTAMHVAGLCVFDPPKGAQGSFGIEDVKDMVRSRLHLAPPFRQRLVSVPFQIHFPIWIEDPNFDIDHHIKAVTVPAPGGMREVAELASQLNAVQLDRTRPLWEMWFIDGLEGGRFATLTKVHHAAIDGASGSEITLALLDLTPEITQHPEPEPWKPEAIPSDVEMLAYAGQSLVRQPVQLVEAVRRTVRAAVDMRSLSQEAPQTKNAPLPFSAPRTSINGAITGERSVAFSRLSLSDVKRVKNAFGCTVNDVVLAVCASTLRNYFEQRGEDLDGPLVAMVPVSVRTEDQREAMGNRVSSMFANLATDEADPVARLLTIHEGMRGAKEQHKAVGADTLTNWAEFAAPAVFGSAMRLYTRLSLADRHRPVFNVTISNVPGPPFPLYSAGAEMVANFPVGPILDGAALNITVMSYQDSIDVGICTCPEVVDDVWILSDGLQDALDDLLAAADTLERTGSADRSRNGRVGSKAPAAAATSRVGSTAGSTSATARRTAKSASTTTPPAVKKAAAAKRAGPTSAAGGRAPAGAATTTAKASARRVPSTVRRSSAAAAVAAPAAAQASVAPAKIAATKKKASSVRKSPAAKRAPSKASAAKATTTSPASTRSTTRSATKASVGKSTAKKSPGGKSAAKKLPTGKSAAKKSPTKATSAKKVAARTASAANAPTKKTPTKKSSAGSRARSAS